MAGIQFWGLGSGLSGVSDIIDALLIEDEYKLQGYEDKSKLATNKKNAWNDIKTSVDKIETIIKDISGVNKQSFKTSSVSKEGYITATVDSNKKITTQSYSVTVEQLAEKHTVSSNRQSSVNESLNLSGKFSINGIEIEIQESDTLSNVMSKINSAKDSEGNSINAKAYIVDGALFIESSETGKSNTLSFTDESGVLAGLGIIKDDGEMNTVREAKNAMFTVNGLSIERDSNTIDDAIEGVTLKLTNKTTDPIEVKVEESTNDVKELVKNFVNSVNELYTKLAKYTAYDKETETSALLNGDSSIRGIKSAISTSLQGKFDGGEFNYLFEIGISVDKNGKLVLDESALDEALNKNIDDVISLLTKGLDNPTSEPNSSNGIFVAVKNAINSLTGGTDNLFKAKTESLDRQIKNYQNLISRQEAYIERRRAMLEAQFSAMEQSMNSYNSQLSYLGQLNFNNNSDD